MQNIAKPMDLTGAKNVRDLGGYKTQEGKTTKKHSLLRGDALHILTDEDCRKLYDYGVYCIIDLRSADEVEREPDRLPKVYTDIEYLNVPIQDHVRGKRYLGEFPPSMWQLYCWMLDDCKESFYTIFKTIAKYKETCVLFHCSGGKDRTGTIAMLLLKLAGVDNDTIIGDYLVTQDYMKEVFIRQTKDLEGRGFTVPHYIMESPPENMERTLKFLEEKYGTVEAYFKEVGFDQEQIDNIRSKLID